MPTIKIENKCDDDIVVVLDGKEYICLEDESINVDNCLKGKHKIVVSCKKIPYETNSAPQAEQSGFEKLKSDSSKIKSHIHLSTEILFETISSRSVAVITKDISISKRPLAESILVGYSAKISGSNNVTEKSFFPNKTEKRRFRIFQFNDAFFPVGLIGVVLLLASLFCLSANAAGAVIMIGSKTMTPLYSLIFLLVSVAILVYFNAVMVILHKTIKKYSIKNKIKNAEKAIK